MKKKIAIFILLVFILNYSFIPSVNINTKYHNNFITNYCYPTVKTKPQIEEFTISTKNNFPPYVEKYNGSKLIVTMEYDVIKNRLFYPLEKNGIGIYFFNNDSHQEIYLKNTTSYFFINKMLFDHNNSNLFIGSTNGLYILNIDKRNVTYFDDLTGLPSININSMAFDKEHEKMYLSTDYGLAILDSSTFDFLDLSELPTQFKQGCSGKLEINEKGNSVYFNAGNKLICYNISTNIVSEIFYSSDYNYSFIRSLCYNNNENILYMGCHGVIVFDCNTNTVIRNYNQTSGLTSNVVNDVSYTPNFGGMIFAEQNFNGFAVINTSSSEIDTIRREDNLLTNYVGGFEILSKNESYSELVIGLRGAFSIFKILENKVFNTITYNYDLPTVFCYYLTNNPDKENLIFISNKEYLSIFNITNGEFSNYDYIYGLPEAAIRQTIFNCENNKIFLSTFLGVYAFDLEEEQVERVYTTNQGLSNNSTYSMLYESGDNTLYIGTETGLDKLDLNTNEISCCLGNIGRINSIEYYNETNQLMLGVSSQLYIYNPELGINQTDAYSTLDFEGIITSLDLHLEKEILFVGTEEGLFIVDAKTMDILTHYTPENSILSDSEIDSIYFDEETGKLYIANLGVVILDYEHNFWVNLNVAELKEEDLYRIYIEDILYSNEKLFLAAPYNGFYVINMSDTDKDGIENCLEEWIFKTNLTLFDTDGDGYGDGEELWIGTDPLNSRSYPYKTQKWWLIPVLISIGIITPLISTFIYRKQKNKTRKK